ncbi:hypothetical protein J7K25_02330 [bacterium]|nr:hypothetical protein [bacterium]
MDKCMKLIGGFLTIILALVFSEPGYSKTLFLCHYNGNTPNNGLDADYAKGSKSAFLKGGGAIITKNRGGYPFKDSQPSPEGLSLTGSGILSYPAERNIDVNQGTIEFWVKTRWSWNKPEKGVTHTLIRVPMIGGKWNGFTIFRTTWQLTPVLCFNINDGKGHNLYIHIPESSMKTWRENEWHHIAVCWTKDESVLFADGEKVGYKKFETPLKFTPPKKIYVGCDEKKQEFADVIIDELRISDVPLYLGLERFNVPQKHEYISEQILSKSSKVQSKPIIAVSKTQIPPTIDGVINEKEWRYASAVTGFVDTRQYNYVADQTIAYITYDDKRLYIAFESKENKDDLVANVEKRDGPTWKDDAVEIYLQPDIKKPDYIQFIGNPNGAIYDTKETLKWNGKWQFENKLHGGKWTCEISIPFEELGVSSPKDGDIWGINLCRDVRFQKKQGYYSSWSPARNFENPKTFGRVVFKENIPAVKLLSFGNILSGEFNLDNKVFMTGSNMIRLNGRFTITIGGKKLLEKQDYVEIIPAMARQKRFCFEGNFPVEEGFKYTAEFIVFDKEHVYYKHTFNFTPIPSFRVGIKKYFEEGKLYVTVNAIGVKNLPEHFNAELKIEKNNKVKLERIIDKFYKERKGEVVFDISGLEEGNYYLIARLIDKKGKIYAEKKVNFKIPSMPIWMKVQIGVTDEVPPPWTPIVVNGKTLKCWGREYIFNDKLFPERIVTKGENILYEPISLNLIINGGDNINLSSCETRIISKKKNKVRVRTFKNLNSLYVQADNTLEFDGMMKIELELKPKKEIEINSLIFEIPVKKENALYIHYVEPPKKGSSFTTSGQSNAGAIGNKGWKYESDTCPLLWIGDNDRGICWFVEKQEGWSIKEGTYPINVLNEGDVVKIRINIINKAIHINKPYKVVMGIQSTPVKPVPPLNKYMRVTSDSNPPVLNRLKKVDYSIWWPPYFNKYKFFVVPKENCKRRIEWFHKRGIKVLPYCPLCCVTESVPEFKIYGDEWVVWPKYSLLDKRTGENAWLVSLQSKSWQNFIIYKWAKFLEEYDVDGLYYDVAGPLYDTNYHHGAGYRRWEEKKIRPSYNIFSAREAFKRLYIIVKKRDPDDILYMHISGHILVPIASFSDVVLDGEQYCIYQTYDDLTPEKFRAEFMGRPSGLYMIFLPQLTNPAKTKNVYPIEEIIALTLPHNVMPQINNYHIVDYTEKVWDILDNFHIEECKWIPYWKIEPYIKGIEKNIYVSIYLKKGKRALFVISNLSEVDKNLNLKIDTSKFGISKDAVLRNCLSKESLGKISEGLKIRVPAKRMKLIIVKND